MLHPKFGKPPSGVRLEQIRQSPNYQNGKFQNLTPRPVISEGYSMAGEMYKMAFKKHKDRFPAQVLPSPKTNLQQLDKANNLIVWFGHSSLYMQLDGKSFLIDPIFSGNASPIPGFIKAFKGTNEYQAEDMPDIDYLIISHDHYDHLDYKTIRALKSKIKFVVCGLGVGSHLEKWHYAPGQIIEMDWNESTDIDSTFILHSLPTHHSSGRSIKTNQSLWLSFLFETKDKKIYLNGDGGYDDIYRKIGERFGSIDFAIMECGQYNEAWQSVHKLPYEVKQASIDINARRIMTVHHSKFSLAYHPWYEPLEKMSELTRNAPYTLATPMIGEVLYLDDTSKEFKKWWEDCK